VKSAGFRRLLTSRSQPETLKNPRFRQIDAGRAVGTVPALTRRQQACMPITLHHESNNTCRLDITGQLTRADWRQCESALVSELQRVGSVKLLCVLKEFQGWEPTEDWNNLAFYVQHGDAIERIAIVGQERWRDLALMFAAADLRKGPVEFFPEHDLIQARAWLSA